MATITEQIKELRERTGAGMMECKKALDACGDVEKAIDQLRKEGKTKVDKKAGRVAAEGVVVAKASPDNKIAIILEINSETDFAARNEHFVEFANQVATIALNNKVKNLNELLALPYSAQGASVEQARQDLIAKIGENIQLRRCDYLETEGAVGVYVHSNRIGVLVNLSNDNADLAKDIAMHIAANNPIVVSPEDVPEELVLKEKEIFTAQAKESGKPPEIIEKMINGQVDKFLNEVSLLGQAFVKDPNIKVGSLLRNHQAEVKQFIRYMVGEGLEKKQVNFADEVMAQVRGVQE